ncbi:Pycsar system effector family protein [Brachybacterium sp. AOP42-B2-9]|uniref:Pycsar system effector family protein n=1 Tax=Brachybacterium sp. AOP42-B2-9 TaxID=3457672 RepID=UPI00403396F9
MREPVVVPELPAHPAVPSINRVAEAWRVLGLVNGWVVHAEAKLGVSLALMGALFAGLIAMAASFNQPSATILALEAVAVVFLVAGVVCASIGILPSYGKSEAGNNPIYYRDIDALDNAKIYAQRFEVATTDPDSVLPHLTQQIYAVSKTAVRKYHWAHRGILLGVLALLSTGLVGTGLLLGW